MGIGVASQIRAMGMVPAMTRRNFIHAMVSGIGALTLPKTAVNAPGKALRFGVIADVHHGLAPDALSRMATFLREVHRRGDLDLVIQLGDFCHVDPVASDFLKLWKGAPCPRLDVLGNHDMDKYSKSETMRVWGMPSRYGATVIKGYRWVWLDLNYFLKDGQLHSYSHGNYFTNGARHNYADPEQLAWLQRELQQSVEPVILLAHQPLGIPGTDGTLPPEQLQIAEILRETDKVRLCLSGHLHVDRIGAMGQVPCLSVNSASYFWYRGMNPYTRPLFAFMEIKGDALTVQGRTGEFETLPPDESATVEGRSASIMDRTVMLPA